MALTHGGDRVGYRLQYGCDPLDFSANIAPLGVPEPVTRAICAAAGTSDAYPDPLCRKLCAVLSEKMGVSPEYILCGNGAADLIFRLVSAQKPRRALLPVPAFSEYEAALSAVGCAIERHLLTAEDAFLLTPRILPAITDTLDLLILTNPNNPTGRTIAPALLDQILTHALDHGVTVLLDECFCALLDAPSQHTRRRDLARYPNLVLLDALTKSHGMAGVRLGYALSADTFLLEAMRAAGQPWAVSSLAEAAGVAALSDHAYLDAVRALLQTERVFLREGLSQLGLSPIGEANFLFFFYPCPDFAARLAARGILIRDCSDFSGLTPGYYRVAVRTRLENETLLAAIAAILKGGESPCHPS